MTGGVDEDGASSPERLAAVAANVENLARFSTWAAGRGVETGLWTQSALTPSPDPEVTWQNLRDFRVEVGRAGISALKTDEEWVGPGYSFALDATRQAYHILGEEARRRPFVLTVDGWAGTQRYGAVWSGDQDGTDWEYIRMHLPTYLGQGLSGNPNVASDVDGIFGGDPLVATRDFQWKALTPLMLDMDGWGSLAKTPYTYGDPYTGVCRMYLKLKSELMPYLHTCAVAAAGVEAGNGDAHLPMVRSLLLAGCEGAGLGPEQLSYEFLLGDSLLVAPVWRATRPDSLGGDVRDAIYLPGGEKDLWFDYFSGAAYAGGQTLDGFDAPLWKLPLFVRAGAILPRYEAHNNPRPATESNPRGLDRTRRVVDFYPAPGVSGRYVLQEDDGDAFENRAVSEPGYGVVDDVSYGGSVSTVFSLSSREGQTVLRAEASQGGYPGYDPLRATTFRIRVDGRPASVRVRSGEKDLELREVSSAAELAAAGLAPGEAAWLYEEAPAVETHAPREERLLADLVGDAHGAPRVSVRFARVDVSACAQEVLLA
nr:TIM-barrel domain-containing protein [Olsenella profusa]